MTRIFAKFGELSLPTTVLLVVLILIGLGAFVPGLRRKWSTRMLVRAALCISLSFVLSYIRLWRMPQGGSITPASMLPIMLFAYLYGVGPGMLVGTAYGLLQLLQDFWVTHPMSLILDYPLAFAMLGLAGLFSKQNKLLPGMLIAGLGRFLSHTIGGILFYQAYAAEAGLHPVVYSSGYNSFVAIDLAICIALTFVPQIRAMIQKLKTDAGR